jgi:hypothetical protein
MIIENIVIERPRETKRINETKKWVLVYGRRKTGKTFLVENFIRYDEYFFVKKDRSIISKRGERVISYDTFLEILRRTLEENKTIVIDEFHRLGEDFFDFIHYTKKEGKLILISSTLFLSKKLLSSHSPLLGFFAENQISLIDIEDIVRVLRRYKLNKKELVEMAILLKEPLAIDYFDEKKKPKKILCEIIRGSIKTIPALIGEVFNEEERGISAIYEGVLRAVASGKITSSEISSYLFSMRLIKKDDPSIIQQYLTNLVNFGILKKVRIYNKDRFVYKHVSPLVRLFYYADEKYNISERIPNDQEIERIIDEILPRIIEDVIREFIANKLGLIEAIVETKDHDIDAYLLKFKKPEIAIEIKWKKIRKEDIERAEENLFKVNARKRLMFVPDKKSLVSKKIEIIDIEDLIDRYGAYGD